MHSPKALRQAQALLARWFLWHPSELDALTVMEFEDYLQEAAVQIHQEHGQRLENND